MRGVSGFDRPGVQWTFVLIAAALVAISTWTGAALVRARREIADAHTDADQGPLERDRTEEALARERSARESFVLQLRRERDARPAPPPTLTLAPLTHRSPTGPELVVPAPATPLVQLRLVLPAGAPANRRFTVTLRSWTSGDVLWSRGSLSAGTAEGKPAVIVAVASDVLAPGPYEVLVSAGNPANEVAAYEMSIVPASPDR